MDTKNEFRLMQLSDSFFPSGMFSMSGGLEPLVKDKKINDWKQVFNFIKEQIEFQIIPCDCTVVSIATRFIKNHDLESLIEVDKKYFSMKLSKEVRNSSVRSGKQILNTLIHMLDKEKNDFLFEYCKKNEQNLTPCTYPIALGLCGVYLDIPLQSLINMLLYSFSSSVVSSAIRLGLIQHLDAQKILKLLAEENIDIIMQLKEKKLQDIWQSSPLTEIYQMNHERSESKMFIT